MYRCFRSSAADHALVLLAAFLFAKFSPRLHSWIKSTWVYRNYVDAFLQAGGMPVNTKIRALLISYAVMGASAFFVRIWFVWIILGCAAVFLLWLFFLKIPTVVPEEGSRGEEPRGCILTLGRIRSSSSVRYS